MKCTSPFRTRQGSVPCGKCMACRITRTSHWQARLLHEQSCWDKSVFLTLTYRNEDLPSDFSLSVRELQLYLKRLRRIKAPSKIKYFACGEYGDSTHRPHYHAIIFGIGRKDPDLKEAWGKGNIYCGSVTADSIKYVSAYVQKKISGRMAKEVYGERIPPFQLQSKGLGLDWLKANEQQVLDKLSVSVKGKYIGLPRYYRVKLGDKISEERLLTRGLLAGVKLDEQLEQQGLKWIDAGKYTSDLAAQRARQVDAKIGLYKPRNGH